jgi:antitoxin Phd
MTIFTFSQARQNFAQVLEKAKTEEVLIKRRDGSVFSVKSAKKMRSPLAVRGLKTKITAQEIVDVVREVRHRN